MAELAERVLAELGECEGFDSLTLAEQWGVDHQRVVGAVKSLQAQGDVRAFAIILIFSIIAH